VGRGRTYSLGVGAHHPRLGDRGRRHLDAATGARRLIVAGRRVGEPGPVARDVLVGEEEPDIRNLIVHHLTRDGFRCRTAATGTEALARVRSAPPDLVVLDLMLPEMDGLEVCRRLRGNPSPAPLPLIMLTAKADEVDRIVGLELGADDYLAKPFSPKELVARVRAVLRRTRPALVPRWRGGAGPPRPPPRHTVTVAGRPVELTPKEFDLLQTLLEAAG